MRVMVGHSVLIGSVQMTGIPGAICTERQQDWQPWLCRR